MDLYSINKKKEGQNMEICCSLIDWTVATSETEIRNCKSMENKDWFSDHLPVKFEIKLN